MRSPAIDLGLLSIVFCSCCMQAATLPVVVLDGKSGRPVTKQTVEIYSTEPASTPLVSGLTDQKGVFSTSVQLPKAVAVYVKGRYICSGRNQGTSVHGLNEILSKGVAELNYCNLKVLASPEPGELILFVRHENLKEFLDLD